MTIEEMKAKKAELGYTNETVARLSGVPLGTVQKIFAGETKAPRYDTILKLQKILGSNKGYTLEHYPQNKVAEEGYIYNVEADDATSRSAKYPAIKSKKKIGLFDGKYKMPADELMLGDDLSDLFEDI